MSCISSLFGAIVRSKLGDGNSPRKVKGMKTNKHLTLSLVKDKESVRARDIVEQFDYSQDTARSYLSYLARNGMLERTGRGYVLTDKGSERLQYFDALGCSSFDCPLCMEKKADHFTCPECGHELPKKEARMLPEKDFFDLAVRHAGVYCPECKELIFDEKKAQLLGIPKESDK